MARDSLQLVHDRIIDARARARRLSPLDVAARMDAIRRATSNSATHSAQLALLPADDSH